MLMRCNMVCLHSSLVDMLGGGGCYLICPEHRGYTAPPWQLLPPGQLPGDPLMSLPLLVRWFSCLCSSLPPPAFRCHVRQQTEGKRESTSRRQRERDRVRLTAWYYMGLQIKNPVNYFAHCGGWSDVDVEHRL